MGYITPEQLTVLYQEFFFVILLCKLIVDMLEV